MSKRPRVAVFKFASCDGCQLQLLNAEDELLDLTSVIDIAYFPEGRSRMERGPYDIALVEGSITTPHDARRILDVRREAKLLVTIGACATAGGIQALRNGADVEEYKRIVYPSPEWINALSTSTPISEHVKVDYELWGCPIDKGQLLAAIRSLLDGAVPTTPSYSVCIECKRAGAICAVVARGETCLGPVTRAGCGAICPRMNRGCYGCFGPAEADNARTFVALLRAQGLDTETAQRRLRFINGYARPEVAE